MTSCCNIGVVVFRDEHSARRAMAGVGRPLPSEEMAGESSAGGVVNALGPALLLAGVEGNGRLWASVPVQVACNTLCKLRATRCASCVQHDVQVACNTMCIQEGCDALLTPP